MEKLSNLIRGHLTQASTTALNGDHVVAGLRAPRAALTPAAVLVPLIARAEGYSVLLTKRSEHLAHHPGQVSFPGGRSEPHDSDAIATALRETQEEIGLGAEFIEIVGQLDFYQTVTNFMVTPVVGLVRPGFNLDLDDFEVAEVFEVPLAHALNPSNHQRQSRVLNGQRREYYVIPYQNYFIWGATAAMLVNLAGRLDWRWFS